MTVLEAEDVDVPLRGAFDIEHAERDMVDSFNFNHTASFALIELSRTRISANE